MKPPRYTPHKVSRTVLGAIHEQEKRHFQSIKEAEGISWDALGKSVKHDCPQCGRSLEPSLFEQKMVCSHRLEGGKA